MYSDRPFAGFTYELTETSNHDSCIRYLPAGVAVGVKVAKYTTVGTYPAANAYTALLANVKNDGFKELPSPTRGSPPGIRNIRPASIWPTRSCPTCWKSTIPARRTR